MPNITHFKSKLNGGVRPNLYQVDINFPDIIDLRRSKSL